MKEKILKLKKFVEDNRFLDETYFIVLSVVLAFGILQTMGAGLGTDKPVVTVISTSMCPALQVGDILLVKNTPYDEVSKGDIIVYNVPDTAKFEIGGEIYSLESSDKDPTPAVNTSMGKVELVDVKTDTKGRDSVLLRINGEVPDLGEGGTRLVEDETYQIGNGTIRVAYLTDLPYGNVPVVHRVIRKTDSYVETMGDNNPSQLEFERRVEPQQIHGTVFLEIPRLGLVKILAMDFLGYNGDRPFVFDATPGCGRA